MKPLYAFIALLICHAGFSQNYLGYYKDLDSARYYEALNLPLKAEICYKRCLTGYKGFPDDYEKGIVNYYAVHTELNYDYAARAFACGLWKFDLKYTLKKNKIPFSRHKLRKAKHKNKLRKTVSTKPLRKLLHKDQKHRRGKPNWEKMRIQDSLNTVKFINLYKTKHDLFDRLKTKHYYAEMIWVLMAHQDWKKIEPIFYDLRKDVETGCINRFTLNYFFDRNAISGRSSLAFDTASQKFVNVPITENTFCDKMHYSILGDFAPYDGTTKKNTVLPTNPAVSDDVLNATREFMFLSPIQLFRKTSNAQFFTPDAFCEYANNRHAQQENNTSKPK